MSTHYSFIKTFVTRVYLIANCLGICGRLKCSEGRCTKGDGFDKRCVACGDHPQCTWDQHFPDTCRRSVLVNTTGFDPNYRCRNVPNRDHDR